LSLYRRGADGLLEPVKKITITPIEPDDVLLKAAISGLKTILAVQAVAVICLLWAVAYVAFAPL
jgi:hypothetical protein